MRRRWGDTREGDTHSRPPELGGGMVILKSQTRVKLTRPQLKTHVRGVQNTQDHFKGPHWTRVLSGSVPRISDARPPPQAANAHTGQNRSKGSRIWPVARGRPSSYTRRATPWAQDSSLFSDNIRTQKWKARWILHQKKRTMTSRRSRRPKKNRCHI